MRHLVLFVTFCMLLWAASSSAINRKRLLVNRPHPEGISPYARNRRSPNGYYGVKEAVPSIKSRMNTQPMEMRLRKGEYICGNRICKLKAGEVPKGCNGICQYPI